MGNILNPATPISQFYDSDVPLEPTNLRAGDSWNWMRAFPDYPSGLYQLKYILNSASNRFVLDGTLAVNAPITADSDGQSFDVQAPASLTNGCPADTYQLVAILIGITGTTAAGEQVTLPLQDVCVAPNLAGASGPVDTRSNVKKNLDAVEQCLLGNTDPSVSEYMINGRQLRRFPRADLIKERSFWRAQYKAELRAKGEYCPRRVIGFRFTASV
jgi:hypothetical protein